MRGEYKSFSTGKYNCRVKAIIGSSMAELIVGISVIAKANRSKSPPKKFAKQPIFIPKLVSPSLQEKNQKTESQPIKDDCV